MKKARKGQELPDLRYSSDEHAHVNGGVLYRKNTVVQLFWDNGSIETWWLEASPENLQEAKAFFVTKRVEHTY